MRYVVVCDFYGSSLTIELRSAPSRSFSSPAGDPRVRAPSRHLRGAPPCVTTGVWWSFGPHLRPTTAKMAVCPPRVAKVSPRRTHCRRRRRGARSRFPRLSLAALLVHHVVHDDARTHAVHTLPSTHTASSNAPLVPPSTSLLSSFLLLLLRVLFRVRHVAV